MSRRTINRDIEDICCAGYLFDIDRFMGTSWFIHTINRQGHRDLIIDTVSNGVTNAYIQDLMGHPCYQGKGMGTEFMNRTIAYLKGRKIYMISVVFEETLLPFYKRFGFFNMLCGQMQTYEMD